MERSNLKITKNFPFVCSETVRGQDGPLTNSRCSVMMRTLRTIRNWKLFLEENCPNTCGYCSKFILDILARLIQLDGGILLLLLSRKRELTIMWWTCCRLEKSEKVSGAYVAHRRNFVGQ